jgi:hypothetical protein
VFPLIAGRDGTQAVTIDVSITNPMAKTVIARPAREANRPLAAARLREREKEEKYLDACKLHNLDFRSFVLESSGALGQSARDFLALLLGNSCSLPEDAASPEKRFHQNRTSNCHCPSPSHR